jgi:hypothetical protein
VLNHPQIGARLHHNTERVCQAITAHTAGDIDGGTAATVRATASLGSLWRPLRTLTPAQLDTHRDTLLHAAMAGWVPTTTRPDPTPGPTPGPTRGPTPGPIRPEAAAPSPRHNSGLSLTGANRPAASRQVERG